MSHNGWVVKGKHVDKKKLWTKQSVNKTKYGWQSDRKVDPALIINSLKKKFTKQ